MGLNIVILDEYSFEHENQTSTLGIVSCYIIFNLSIIKRKKWAINTVVTFLVVTIQQKKFLKRNLKAFFVSK